MSAPLPLEQPIEGPAGPQAERSQPQGPIALRLVHAYEGPAATGPTDSTGGPVLLSFLQAYQALQARRRAQAVRMLTLRHAEDDR